MPPNPLSGKLLWSIVVVVVSVVVESVSVACAVIMSPPMTAAKAVNVSRVSAAIFLFIFPPPPFVPETSVLQTVIK
jgi:hypothetical protein